MNDLPLGVTERMTRGGSAYLRIHYTADPGKRYSPEEVAQKRLALGARKWDMEMEMMEDVFDGKPVFENYNDDLHCPVALRELPEGMNYLQAARAMIQNGSTYFGGWDSGTSSLCPAFVLCQVTPRPFQIHALFEVSMLNTSLDEFIPLVSTSLMQWHPGLWANVKHYCDPAAAQRSGLNKKSAMDEAKLHNFKWTASTNVLTSRIGSVNWALTRMINKQTPGLFVLGAACPILRAGLKGGYRYQENTKSKVDGRGEMWNLPEKDSYSHPMDAFQYAMMAIKKEYGDKINPGSVENRR
jgi:hypothetical protein